MEKMSIETNRDIGPIVTGAYKKAFLRSELPFREEDKALGYQLLNLTSSPMNSSQSLLYFGANTNGCGNSCSSCTGTCNISPNARESLENSLKKLH